MIVSVGTPDSATRKYIVKVLTSQNIGRAVIDGVVSKKFDFGLQTQPGLTVRLNGKTLEKDVDYTVSYRNNIDPGIAYMTVSGIGKYVGTREIAFQIIPDTFDISESDPYFN